jgi:GNAT superfamily N-acetyltransferase
VATAAAAVTEVFQRFAALASAGWSERSGEAFAWVTGVDLPTLNGVIVERPRTVDVATVASLLDRVAATGLSHSLQVRPPLSLELAHLAERRGLVREDDVPLMAVDSSRLTTAGRPVAGLDVRLARSDDRDLLARLAASGFGAPVEVFNDLVALAYQTDGLRAYVAYLDAEAAGTAMGLTTDDSVAVFTVSTLADRRRQGIGTALSARAVLDGHAAGCTWSWLQSSPIAHNLYGELGFVDLEVWACWVGTS